MKKLNNKGFAISTVLYSLLIMVLLIVVLLMGIMASNRHNSKDLVSTIEEELNRYSLTATTFSATDTTSAVSQEFIVPYGKAGWYKIELWGASGGDVGGNKGGAGAYTSGVIYLEENEALYFYVGTKPSSTAGGANGGGKGSNNAAGGGGATDVRLVSGTWNDASSLQTRIMVASGGSGATQNASGQNGGSIETYSAAVDNGATQTSGGTSPTGGAAGRLGIGGDAISNGSGGGAGYFGGAGGASNQPGGGGSSFISGYAGVNSDNANTNNHYFINGKMSENSNSLSGKAKIELISLNSKDNPPTKKNSKLENVRYIKDCVSGTGYSTKTSPQWVEIQAIKDGVNIAKLDTDTTRDGKLDSIEQTGTYGTVSCKEIDLGQDNNLDEIAVWHIKRDTLATSERILSNHTLEVKSSSGTWQSLISTPSEGEYSMPEGAEGIHITAWDPSITEEIPNGTYYIFSSLAPSTSAITALNSYEDSNDAASKFKRMVGLDQINGSNLQKWTITKVDATYYKLVERESNQAMQIVDNKGQANSNINTSSSYDDQYNWTKWEIIPLHDGTYRIKPYVQPTSDSNNQTYLTTRQSNFGLTSGSLILSKYQSASFSQRFYIINAE